MIDHGRARLEMNVTPTQDRRRTGALRIALASTYALFILIAPPCASAGATSTVSPLPASDYTVRPACAAPAPGHAGCLALALMPGTAAARAHTHPLGMTRSAPLKTLKPAENGYGLRPTDLRAAYFPGEQPEAPPSEPQTIALVDAYNDPHAEADLNIYAHEFGLAELTRCTGGGESNCFEKVNQKGETTNPPFPTSEAERQAELAVCEKEEREAACKQVEEAEGWALEISTDVEMARAVCQSNCKILLVEADSSSDENLEEAERTAVALGAGEISNSWGGGELRSDSPAFNHPGIVITASAGDDGYLNWTQAEEAEAHKEEYNVGANYPASSPHVVAVGGTKLTLSGGIRQSETVWNDDPGPEGNNNGAGGGGCSLWFAAQEWQRNVPAWSTVGCEDRRAVADVSADADPYTGVAVYDSVPYVHEEEGKVVNTPFGWVPIGGTSVASPIIASMFALAGGAHGVAYPAKTLYAHLGSASLHDITAGGNGKCDGAYEPGCPGSMSPLSPFDCGQHTLICNAATGYDGPTGVGTPDGIAALQPLVEEGKKQTKVEEEKKSKEAEEEKSKKKTEEEERSAESGGSPKGGGGEGSRESGAGGTSNSPISVPIGVSLPNSALPTAPPTPPGSSAPIPILSAPVLTKGATAALSHTRPQVSRVAFAFTLNVADRVRVTLAKQVVAHGRKRWQTLPDSLTIAGAPGRDSARLSAHAMLAPGRYRLTLAPAHGIARTLTFQVG